MSSLWDFIRRHRTKMLIGGATIGGFIVLNRYLSSWEKAWQKSSSRDFVSEVKRKEIHFENTIDTCNSTCVTLSAKVLDIMDTALDTQPLLDAIRASPERKIQLFNELKIRIFTRLISEVYCLVLFVAYLRVQLSVIAGYIYVDSTCNGVSSMSGSLSSSSSSLSSSSSVQQKYLSILQSFYSDGIHKIIEPVQSAVENAMSDISLKDRVILNDLKSVFEKVKSSMTFTLCSTNSNASHLLINPEKITALTSKDNGHSSSLSDKEVSTLKRMFTETEDILESDDFRRVLNAGVDIGFSIMMDMLLGCFVRLGADHANGEANGFVNPHTIDIPLAKVLPAIRQSLIDRKNSDDKLLMVRHLICLDVLNCFAANIYEAFCNSDQSSVKLEK